jgi:glycosyltransferase involved in cell wall biosynthesis
MMPKVSVVVPSYNRAHLLDACLESVVRQTYRDFEIVVVDDGSTDNTAEVAARYAPLARYVWQENRGIPEAYNRGIQEARGEYILFVDSDDQLLEEALGAEVAVLDENDDVGLAYAQAWQVDESGAVTALRKPAFARGAYIRSGREEIKDLLFWCHITSPTPMVRRRCFDDVGPFDPQLPIGEDWDMWIRIAKKYDVAYIDRPLGKYLKHSGNISMRIDIPVVDSIRCHLLESVFGDPELASLYEGWKGKAFFAYHFYIASVAYKANHMGMARRRVVQAFRSEPRGVLRRSGFAAAFLFLKTLIPIPALMSMRSAMGKVRSLLRRGAKEKATIVAGPLGKK